MIPMMLECKDGQVASRDHITPVKDTFGEQCSLEINT